MATQQFANTSTPISVLVEQIDSGELGLPDLQRPFVWKRTKIRDLFDSLYRGYPAGYFLFWRTIDDVDTHAIGTAHNKRTQQNMIVDGQQRLTSLYAVIKGKEVINEDNEVQLIRIAFNPLTEEFMVANAASDKNPEFVNSITDIWLGTGVYKYISDFINGLREDREVLPEDEAVIGERLGRLHAIVSYQFSALELSGELDINTVAEIFQRINSKGVALNSADFILTLMSVHWVEGRHELEDFARAAKKPSVSQASPYNHFHTPSPDELLRVVVGLGLKRGVLQQAYQVLLGRDPKKREITDENRDARFDDLKAAQVKVLNLTSWHEYMVAVKQAGFLGKSMLTSANNFLYGYLIYLIGKHEFDVGRRELRDIVCRWFFMSSLTGRYTGSPETILESDLRRIEAVDTAEGFVSLLSGIIDTQLTTDFWEYTVPYNLESSAAWSPTLFGYYASLNLLDATALFSKMRINSLLSPDLKQPKSPIERHHLFPKAYLSSIGITGSVRVNQIANYAFVEWADNIAISDKPPSDYFPKLFSELSINEQKDAEFWHALPKGWEDMDYVKFLEKRRIMVAAVIRAGYEKLSSGSSSVLDEPHLPTIEELLRQMETFYVEFKATARVALNLDVPEKVINESVIKTVAAFMNSDGGTLAIGITDDGDILGLQPDLDYKKQDLDSYQNWLSTLFINSMNTAVVANYVTIRLETEADKVVCLVDVRPSAIAVYADTIKGKEVFYVRVGNSTRILSGAELVEYVKERF